jgi:uncharacterized membrane protein
MENFKQIFSLKGYFLPLTALLMTLTAAGLLILGERCFTLWFLAIPCYFLVLGIYFYFAMKWLVSHIENSRFISYHIAFIFSKLLISVVFIVLYLLYADDPENRTVFVMSFFVFYVAYSVFERLMTLKLTKQSNKSDE